jgi:hypothetical protein
VQAIVTAQFVGGVVCTATATMPSVAVSRLSNATILASATASAGVAQALRVSGAITFARTATTAAIADGAHTYDESLSFEGILTSSADSAFTHDEAIAAFAIAAVAIASTGVRRTEPQIVNLSGNRRLIITLAGTPSEPSHIDLHLPGQTIH